MREVLWVAAAHAAYSVTPDGALLLLALLLGAGLVLLDAVRGLRVMSPIALARDAALGVNRAAAGTPHGRPSRFFLSTFRC